jgi:hypothetical protein
MQTRHRTPTIFNLSMVDVLCCALGCVILLWLLNLREAKERAARAGESNEKLKITQEALDQTYSLLLGSMSDADSLAQRQKTTAAERDRLRRELQAGRAELAELNNKLALLRGQLGESEERLIKLSKEQRELAKEKAAVAARASDLAMLLRDRESQARKSSRRAESLAEQLQDEEARARKLQGEIDRYRTKLSDAETRVQSLESVAADTRKDLTDARQSIGALQREKQSLADQASRALAAVENRFEGIALTGRRVIFLVDMSGSMELVDEKTAAPAKWLGVRETLAKVMRSLTDLTKFQVIVFADKVVYPLGNDGRWLDYDPKASADRALKALAETKPNGPTNMYTAFESAFRFRDLGLDTIYVLSDGLPNVGPGLTPEQENNLKETERSEILARHIRNLLHKDWNHEIPGRPRVRINTIGFFFESPDVGAFLWALARENDGSFVGMSKP